MRQALPRPASCHSAPTARGRLPRWRSLAGPAPSRLRASSPRGRPSRRDRVPGPWPMRSRRQMGPLACWSRRRGLSHRDLWIVQSRSARLSPQTGWGHLSRLSPQRGLSPSCGATGWRRRARPGEPSLSAGLHATSGRSRRTGRPRSSRGASPSARGRLPVPAWRAGSPDSSIMFSLLLDTFCVPAR